MAPTGPRLLSHVLLGVLTLLVVGAIALSLATAPPDGPQQLRGAAEATVAAPGFELQDTNSVTSPAATGGQARVEVINVLYEAPDRVLETGPGPNGQMVSVLVAGDRHFSRTGAGWEELPPSPGIGADAVQTVLSPLQAASGATDVARSGDVYRFLPPDLDRFVATILGTSPAALSSLRLTATVEGEFVTRVQVVGVLHGERLEVMVALSRIGSAPPVTVPPASQVTQAQ